jgi:GNAT superfamily N-acetyltransferase
MSAQAPEPSAVGTEPMRRRERAVRSDGAGPVSGPGPVGGSVSGPGRVGGPIGGPGPVSSPGTAGDPTPRGLSWSVRPATHEDVPTVVEAVRELLRELGGTPPATSAMQTAARALLDSPQAGVLLVMEADGTMADAEHNRAIVGVLGASWQSAIHVPGRYALIQDLWVHPLWRGKAIGHELLRRLYALAHDLRITRVEVGLPPERFTGLAETEAFYLANGFTSLGVRMRRGLP